MKNLILIGRYSHLSILLSILWILCLSTQSSGQQDPLKKANELYNQKNYQEALIYLNRVEKTENSGPLLYKRGVIYYHVNQLDRAEMDLNQAVQFGYKKEDIDYYLGKIAQHKGQFSSAAEYYKMYLRQLKNDLKKKEVYHMISQCGQAQNLLYQNPIGIIERLPKPINSIYDDFGWLPSPSDSVTYYFNTNRPNTVINMAKGHHEIYSVKLINNEWNKPKRLSYPINTRADEILTGFTEATNGLYIMRADESKSSVMIHRRGDTKGKQKSLEIAASFSIYNSEIYFYNDQLALFAAKTADGYGGYDIYYAQKNHLGWSQPTNMGSSVNSIHDELDPRLTHDGQSLYFSSNQSNSIGGFDIYKCDYLYESETWSTPHNLGIPINSPGDDKGLQLSSDGLTAHFSSNRKSAMGGFDIYKVRFKERQLGQDYYAGMVPFVDGDHTPIVEITDPDLESIILENSNIPTLEKRAYTLSSLYHLSSEYVDPAINLAKVAQLKEILSSYPDVSLELISSGNDDEIIEYSLFASMKRAEKIRKQILTGTTIDPERIHITGLGNNYPIIKKMDLKADDYNTRIDLKLHDLPEEYISIDMEQTVDVHPSHLDTKYDIYRTIIEADVSYKIEIAKVNQMYRGMALSLFNDATMELDNTTGLYAYTVGLYDNYAEAITTERNLERDGVVDAQVIPYINGLRVSEDQLVNYISEYPNLKDYLNYDRSIGTN